VGKEIKNTFAFCAAGNTGWKATSDSVLNLKYFIQAVKFRWPTQNLMCPSKFLLFYWDPLEIWSGPRSHICPTIRPTAARHQTKNLSVCLLFNRLIQHNKQFNIHLFITFAILL
jgi:hypothetical protein